ncbi:hypothetical protein E4U54_004344 [Claviceps lovelessii]|nr:hypothetical protein E4U54_004344 [Claviceps lovelessii]
MLFVGTVGPRTSLGCLARPAQPSAWLAVASSGMSWRRLGLGLRGSMVLRVQPWRCYAQEPSRRPVWQKEWQRRAKAAASGMGGHDIPERLIIYHAGTGRVAFLAMLKLTSLLLGAFFVLLVVPSYVMAEKPMAQTAAVAMAGVAPILFMSYTTAPLVTHIHVHLPPGARASRALLERFVAAMPASTRLTFTTMSLIGKPRYSSVAVGDLRPVQGRRLGLVNYVRDTGDENATRKWYMYRAVGGFYVQGGPEKGKRYGRKGKVDGWIWDAVRQKVSGR